MEEDLDSIIGIRPYGDLQDDEPVRKSARRNARADKSPVKS